jgi:hypothetical protein
VIACELIEVFFAIARMLSKTVAIAPLKGEELVVHYFVLE